MPLFEYEWEMHPDLTATSPNCRSKECQRAHYKDKQPKQKMHALTIKPHRENYVNYILLCPRCKTIRIPGWG